MTDRTGLVLYGCLDVPRSHAPKRHHWEAGYIYDLSQRNIGKMPRGPGSVAIQFTVLWLSRVFSIYLWQAHPGSRSNATNQLFISHLGWHIRGKSNRLAWGK